MIAGATGIDLFLLVIDAQEGARPQTLEHLAVLRLLGVDRGVVAVTKADAVDAETLALALDEARELVPDSESWPSRRRPGPVSTNCAPRSRASRSRSAARMRRHASTSTASSRFAASGRSRPGRCGPARSPPATCCAASRRGGPSGCGACRCTTRPSSTPRPANASQSTCRDWSGPSSGAATCSSRPGTTRCPTGSTSS